MKKCVLLTGAGGLVGKRLTEDLISKGYHIHALTRSGGMEDMPAVRYFKWDVAKGEIDDSCIDGVDAIIHLAGENISSLPWSPKRRKEILESRTQSIGLIYDLLRGKAHQVKTVVSASATGYYNDRGDEVMTEDKPHAHDFLGRTCVAWEEAVAKGKDFGLRAVSLRSGLVLSTEGGMYPTLRKVINMGAGTVMGTGQQWISWIHLTDAVAAYLFALENDEMEGAYNMVAPEQVRFKTFIHNIALQLGKRIWLPHVPAFFLRAVLGKMSELILSSTRASSEKLLQAGFVFQYPTLEAALKQFEPSR